MNAHYEAVAAWLKPRLPATVAQLHTDARIDGYSLGDLRAVQRLGMVRILSERRDDGDYWSLPTAPAPASAPPTPPTPVRAQATAAPAPAAQLTPAAAHAEWQRRAAILALPEAANRESLALHLCDHTKMTASEARGVLAASGRRLSDAETENEAGFAMLDNIVTGRNAAVAPNLTAIASQRQAAHGGDDGQAMLTRAVAARNAAVARNSTDTTSQRRVAANDDAVTGEQALLNAVNNRNAAVQAAVERR